MTSMRLPASASLTSWIERGWPAASGVRVSGKATVSRSGRTGRPSGSTGEVGTSISSGSPESVISIMGGSGEGSSAALTRDLDRHLARAAAGLGQRQLHAQDAVLIDGLGLVGDDVGTQG